MGSQHNTRVRTWMNNVVKRRNIYQVAVHQESILTSCIESNDSTDHEQSRINVCVAAAQRGIKGHSSF